MRGRSHCMLWILTFLFASCAPSPATASPARSAPPTATSLPSATVTPKPTAKPATATSVPPTPTLSDGMDLISGPNVILQGVQFNLSATLASAVRAQVAPPTESLGELYPAHTEFTLVDYVTQNKRIEPQIQVYPTGEFRDSAIQTYDKLRQLLDEQPASLPPAGIPILPTRPAGQLIDAQIQYLTFIGGSGIRVVTQFAQNAWPINNGDLVYIFQGVTTGGDYYVSAFLPVAASFLPDQVDDPDAVPPVDGKPYPQFNSPNFDTEYSNYREAVTRKLNTTLSQEFAPDLRALDSLIQSLHVEASLEQLAFPCPDAPSTRLRPGLFAYVNPDPPLPNNVRSDAGKSHSEIGDIEPGKAMKILEGPKCADGWVWWKVRALENDLVGWTAEGDRQNYWLIPCPSRNECDE